jgi:Domain of unknown function (DUF4468) with TBP-like fold
MIRFLLSLLLLPVMGFSQEEKKEATTEEVNAAFDSLQKIDGQYEFTEVVQLDSTYKKDILYRNAKLFFANISKSSKDILQYDDRDEGKVIGKGTIQLAGHQNVLLSAFSEIRITNYTLEISCKDGKYKYRLFGFSSEYTYGESDKRKPERITTGSLTVDEAYARTEKGGTKKMERNLFLNTLTEIKLTQDHLKEFMRKKPSKDDF